MQSIKNREHLVVKQYKYSIDNKEEKNRKQAIYRQNNREFLNQLSKEWNEANPERFKENSSRWRKENPERMREHNRYRLMHKMHDISDEEWENCKQYFNHRCSYCGLAIEEHYINHKGKITLGDFHKEHVDDNGSNDLLNCIPSCKSCNSKKHTSSLEDWYGESNPVYSVEREYRIYKWLNGDCYKYIDK